MWPGFDSWTRLDMWVESVVGSLLCSERFFSEYSGFSLSLKTNISKFQFDPGMHGHILNEFLRTPRCSVGKQITFTFTIIANAALDRIQCDCFRASSPRSVRMVWLDLALLFAVLALNIQNHTKSYTHGCLAYVVE